MKHKDELAPLYASADKTGQVAARLQEGVVAQVKHCDASWCRITGSGFDGFIEQQRLWGVYIDEKID
jgi:SH3-like domain-containing protein